MQQTQTKNNGTRPGNTKMVKKMWFTRKIHRIKRTIRRMHENDKRRTRRVNGMQKLLEQTYNKIKEDGF